MCILAGISDSITFLGVTPLLNLVKGPFYDPRARKVDMLQAKGVVNDLRVERQFRSSKFLFDL